jgi:hypothetical protein
MPWNRFLGLHKSLKIRALECAENDHVIKQGARHRCKIMLNIVKQESKKKREKFDNAKKLLWEVE